MAILQNSPKLKTYHPLQGISAFETLRLEWTKSHPHHSEIELLEACRQFAKLAGLNVRENLYQENIESLRGLHD